MPIPNAKLKVLKDTKEVATTETSENGWFSFDKLEAGSYELEVSASGFRIDRYAIIVVKPKESCKNMLSVRLAKEAEVCSDIRVVKHPHFE